MPKEPLPRSAPSSGSVVPTAPELRVRNSCGMVRMLSRSSLLVRDPMPRLLPLLPRQVSCWEFQ